MDEEGEEEQEDIEENGLEKEIEDEGGMRIDEGGGRGTARGLPPTWGPVGVTSLGRVLWRSRRAPPRLDPRAVFG